MRSNDQMVQAMRGATRVRTFGVVDVDLSVTWKYESEYESSCYTTDNDGF